jgi:predicted GIY-YIG superfamily endonuclease
MGNAKIQRTINRTMETQVYKLTRSDGKQYIGITTNIRARLWQHNHSSRFSEFGISNIEILHSCSSYEEALQLEEQAIENHGTFINGLNLTKHGRGSGHDSTKFTTLGYKFKEESRQKMRTAAKKRKAGEKLQSWLSNQTEEYKNSIKKKMSETRKGNHYGKLILTAEIVEEILLLYKSKPNLPGVGLVGKNGMILSYDRAFANMYCSRYNISHTSILNLLKKKVVTWIPIYEKIMNSTY